MFCSKCGTQLADDSVFCNACGTQQGNRAGTLIPTTSSMMSIQDFLALSPGYDTKRKELRKNNNLSIVINVSIFVIGAILAGVFFAMLNILPALLFLIVAFAAGITGVVFEYKTKQKIEKYGEVLYQQYVNSK